MCEQSPTLRAAVEMRRSIQLHAARQRDQLMAELSDVQTPIVMPAYASLLAHEPAGYSRLAEPLLRAHRLLCEKLSSDIVVRFNACLMLDALARFEPDAGPCRLPPSVLALYPRELERILLRARGLERCELQDDTFLKDLAILTHRLIPVGAEFVDPHSGVPRSIAWQLPWRERSRFIRLLAFQLRGFRPMFELHAHVLSLQDFNEDGWIATYHRLAELLALNPRFRGWMSASWFLDPALEGISPHLAYLRQFPCRHGASLFKVADDGAGRSGALSRSSTRQRLYQEGRYVPAIYMRVWPRSSVLRWHRQAAAEWI